MDVRRWNFTALIFALAFSVCASAQSPELQYIRKDTRQETRAATLAQYLLRLDLDHWKVIGPFDNTGRDKYDVVYPPEREFDLDAEYRGKGGRTVRWETIEDDGWSFINLKRFGEEEDNTDGVAYLLRTFEADREGEIQFEMGSDDGLKLWLNGRVVVDAADELRGFNIQDHVFDLPVRQGRNTLLVKVTQGVGGWDFQMRPRLDSRLLAMLEYRLNLDFPASPEYAHYRLLTVLEPEDVVLEVGGLEVMPDGRPIVSTRRGEVWIVENAYEDPPFDAVYKLFAFGLHEPLGACWHDGGLLLTQRAEVTKLIDTDGDDRADWFQTVSDDWGVSGNYHEFAFGPEFDGQGRLWVTLNVGFCDSLGKSLVPWRGWALMVNDDGSTTPVCGGLRSPNGLGRNASGDMFCCDNQGDWVGTNKMMHLESGDWHGHPAGDRWYADAAMEPPFGEDDFKPPAIWFPYDRMGRSAADILLDDTGGSFGPFQGQLFVGDQYAATIMRVSLEKVDGVYQGACYPFLSGLDSGVNRMCWGEDGSMFVGMTNRGWWSYGHRQWGLQRVVYTGVEPFELLDMQARPDGFLLTFTKPLDRSLAAETDRYTMASFTHHRWEKYGSPEIDRHDLAVRSATVSEDGLRVRLVVDVLRSGYVHELIMNGVQSAEGKELLHDEAYYTLNVIPRE